MLERLDHVRVASADPAAAASDYAVLLGLIAQPRRVGLDDSGAGLDAWRVDVGATGVVFAPSSGAEPGMQALVFAGQADAPARHRPDARFRALVSGRARLPRLFMGCGQAVRSLAG